MRAFFLSFVTCLFVMACTSPSQKTTNLSQFIPRKASVIVKTNDLQQLSTQLQNNDFVEAISQTPLAGFINEQGVLLERFKPEGLTLICFTPLGKADYEVSLITKYQPQHWDIDSTATTTVAAKQIKKIQTKSRDFYTLVIGNTEIVSTSQLLLENILREYDEPKTQDLAFDRAYGATASNATASILLRGDQFKDVWGNLFPRGSSGQLDNTFSWASADIDLSNNDILLSGVVILDTSSGLALDLFKGTTPVTNNIYKVTPVSALSVTAITHENWDTYKANLARFEKIDPLKFSLTGEDYLKTFQEVGLIKTSKGTAIAAVSNDVILTEDALAAREEKTSFRQYKIYELGQPSAFAKAYSGLIDAPQVKLYCQIDDVFVFAQNQDILEDLIANYQNKATLEKSEVFKNTANLLSTAASFLHIELLNQKGYTQWQREKAPKMDLEGYPYLATQLIQERDFLLLNTVLNKNQTEGVQGTISQIGNIKFNKPLISSPQLLKNHRTKGMDIAVQDTDNTLYLVSNTGEIFWQKELDSPILGQIGQVDLYRNGRLQLAFTTENTFYILDRNGNEVSPFPISFNDPITQPLAIFDYEKNRNYRFVIVQNDAVLMYDKKAKAVNGFTFKKAESEIIMPPQHIRIGNKDYILIAANNGTLHILSRTGTTRIDLPKTIAFGNQPIYTEGSNFMTYDVNGDKLLITSKGNILENATTIGADAHIIKVDNSIISMRENNLIINEKPATLPFGTYSKPRVKKVGKSLYVSVTNTETSEVYVFDNAARLLENFPVYGISRADIDYLERGKGLGFVTQGDANAVLIYKIN